MRKGQGALGPTDSNGPVMDDIADNNKDSIYQIAESKARQNGANDDAHVCIFNEDCTATTDYRRPMKPFFSSKSQSFGPGQTICADNIWDIWDI